VASFQKKRDELISELLEPQDPPTPFERKKPKAHLYIQYSAKLGRRCYTYGHSAYNLWVLIESDPGLALYNERPPAPPMVGLEGEVENRPLHLVAIAHDGEVQIHSIIEGEREPEDSGDDGGSVIQRWCEQNGFTFKPWSPNDLAPSQRLNNLRQLLRYVCVRNRPVDPAATTAVLEAIGRHRRVTVGSIVQSLGDRDAAVIERSIAELILARKCHSDIDHFPWTRATELSIYDFARTEN
jgi:hypothetical protein